MEDKHPLRVRDSSRKFKIKRNSATEESLESLFVCFLRLWNTTADKRTDECWFGGRF
jgi:hypothetical protein